MDHRGLVSDLSSGRKRKKFVSEVGFEPTPTFVDQNARPAHVHGRVSLESGALDHSAILTMKICNDFFTLSFNFLMSSSKQFTKSLFNS